MQTCCPRFSPRFKRDYSVMRAHLRAAWHTMLLAKRKIAKTIRRRPKKEAAGTHTDRKSKDSTIGGMDPFQGTGNKFDTFPHPSFWLGSSEQQRSGLCSFWLLGMTARDMA